MNMRFVSTILIICAFAFMMVQCYIIYKKYKIKQQTRSDDKNLWIIDNFFSKDEFQYIKDYFSKLEPRYDPRSNDRKTLCISPREHQVIYDYIYKNQKLLKLIKTIKNPNHRIRKKPNYPIEHRKYFTGSCGMPWHLDLSLFKPDGFEIVLTLTNTSDSRFEWHQENTIKSISPKENTLVIVRPETVKHQVTPVNYGERTILKFIIEFVENNKKDNMKKDTFYNEFQSCPF